jgi:DNA invertase Pin-like site-specific DNA recombinase
VIYHYCRVSSKEQNLARQLAALSEYMKADAVFADKESGKNFDRTEYKKMKEAVKSGDVVVIKELDRLGRNKEEVKNELSWFKSAGVIVRILDIPTTLMDFKEQTWIQDLVTNILVEVLGAVAEQEREKIRRRQAEGIAAKRMRPDWKDYGRPQKEIDADVLHECADKVKRGDLTVEECCKQLGISRSTWYVKLKEVA